MSIFCGGDAEYELECKIMIPEVSILIPYIRQQNIGDLLAIIQAHAGIKSSRYETLAQEDDQRIGCPKMLAKLVKQSSASKVLFLGDDSIPQINFLKNALHSMSLLPDGWGLVGFNDQTGRQLPCHWMADKRLLPKLGGEFFHTGYQHCFCDNELMERAQMAGRFIYSPDSIVLHRHPLILGSGGEWDEDYLMVYSKRVFEADKKLFLERRPLWSRRTSN